jgi:sugar phosphate isomerase/epimerase
MSAAREVGIAHLTLLDVSPPELVAVAAAAGFDAVGVRVVTAGPGEEPWPMTPGSPMLEETARRLGDTGVRVLDVEVLVLRPDTRSEDYEPALEAGARLGARFLNVMGDDPDPERIPRPRRLPRAQATEGDDRLLEARAMRLLPGDGELPLDAEPVAAMPPGVPLSVEAAVASLWEALTPLEFARRARGGGAAGGGGERERGHLRASSGPSTRYSTPPDASPHGGPSELVPGVYPALARDRSLTA